MFITNTIDTDLIVLSYVEPSILAYIKTINSNFYSLINDVLDNNKFKITKALINTPHFLENYFDNIEIDKTKLLTICVKNELNLDGLKWLFYIKKCNPNNFTFEYAAKNGNLDILKWMLDNNFPKDAETFMYAALNGKQSYNECCSSSRQSSKDWPLWTPCNFHILKWMFDNNFPKDEWTFSHAALNGNFEILKW